jgi:hypothetical protein
VRCFCEWLSAGLAIAFCRFGQRSGPALGRDAWTSADGGSASLSGSDCRNYLDPQF